MQSLRNIIFAFALLASLVLGATSSLFGETCAYRQQLTLHIQDFAGAGSAGEFYSFDISPDGEQVVAKYALDEDSNFVSLWLGVLELKTRTVVKRVELSKSEKRAKQSNPLFRGDPRLRGAIRYTGDNQRIIVEIGNRIDLFRASDLNQEGAISIDPAADFQGDVIDFAISRDGKRLVLQVGDPITVHLYDVSTRAQLGEWKLAWNFGFALSPDGMNAATPASVPAEHGILPIEIVDAENGSPKAEIKSGFNYHGSSGSDAPVPLFVSNSMLLLTPSGGTDATGHHSGDSLKLFDWHTGRLIEQFPVPNSGTIGIAGASADGKQILTFSMPQSPFAVRADNAWWGHLAKARGPEILFFQRGGATPTCRISRISPATDLAFSEGFDPRYDASLRHVGLSQEGGITIWLRTR